MWNVLCQGFVTMSDVALMVLCVPAVDRTLPRAGREAVTVWRVVWSRSGCLCSGCWLV